MWYVPTLAYLWYLVRRIYIEVYHESVNERFASFTVKMGYFR
jgi:hypothetical protein